MKKNHTLTMVEILVPCILCAVLMVLGTAFDLAFSEAVINQQAKWAAIASGLGQFPQFVLEMLCGILLWRMLPSYGKAMKIIAPIGGTALIAVAMYYFYHDPAKYISLKPLPCVAIALGMGAICLVLAMRFDLTDTKKAFMVVLALLALVLLGKLMEEVIKDIFQRPRMRLLLTTDAVSFHPWYQVGSPERKALLAEGVKSGEFKSFLSGHARHAATLMGYYFVVPFLGKASLKRAFYWGGFLWGLVVALSRIVLAAHFITDIAAGLFVSVILVVILDRVLHKKGII